MGSPIRNTMAPTPAVIARYELKYLIPHDLIEPISEFIALYCVLDEHSAVGAGHFYPVNSLYFDTLNYRFLKLRMWGADHRFNMRVRAYGDGDVWPYYAEVKYKSPSSVRKFRAPVPSTDWPRFLADGDPPSATGMDEQSAANQRLFLRLARSYAIEPKIFTCYKRRAFVSMLDAYARVTMDIEMRYRPQNPLSAKDPYSLRAGSDCLNYDTQTIYDDQGGVDADVVLELKAEVGAVPLWMMELIRRFELKQIGFSKYLNSTLVEHLDHGTGYMPLDRAEAVSMS